MHALISQTAYCSNEYHIYKFCVPIAFNLVVVVYCNTIALLLVQKYSCIGRPSFSIVILCFLRLDSNLPAHAY